MKKLIFILSIFLSCATMAQEPVALADKQGTWNYSYLNDANTKMYSQNFGMSAKDITDFKIKMDRLVEVLHMNPVFADPRGFNATVESRPFYPHDFKKHKENWGYIGEINFRLPMWFESKGRMYTQNIEPPRMTVYFNHLSLLKRSTFNVTDLKSVSANTSGGKGAAGVNGSTSGGNAAERLRDICKPMIIKELAPGVILYDYAIVFTKPGKPMFLPLTVEEGYSRLLAYYEAAVKEDPYNEVFLKGIKEEYATLSPEQLKKPAYFGGMFAGITAEKNDDPLMLFNNDFFDRSLPKSAVQVIIFPVDSDYFRKESDFSANSVGYKRIYQVQHSLDYDSVLKVVD